MTHCLWLIALILSQAQHVQLYVRFRENSGHRSYTRQCSLKAQERSPLLDHSVQMSSDHLHKKSIFCTKSPPRGRLYVQSQSRLRTGPKNKFLVPSLAMWRGTKGRYPRCELVANKVGGSPWNTLGGNSENSIRPQTLRPVCTLYSPRSESGRASTLHRNDQRDDHRDDDAE
jgi:hypothetical protein